MERNMEEQIKQSFAEFELPFDPKAWDSMRVQLDNRMPVKSAGHSKWFLGGFLSLIGIGGVVYYLNLPEKQYNKNPLPSLAISTSADKKVSKSEADYVENLSSKKTIVPSIQNPIETKQNDQISNEINVPIATNNPPLTRALVNVMEVKIAPALSNGSISNDNQPTYSLPVIQLQRTQCKGTIQQIENTNKAAIHIETPSGEKIRIEAGTSFAFQPEQQGVYQVVSEDQLVIDQITVQDTKKLDFSYDGTVEYQSGLPTCIVRTTETYGNPQWTVNGKAATSENQGMQFYPFTKGTYVVQLSTINQNGCSSTCSKEIQINEEYNLMAVTAFEPNSTDIRKNRFIPFALTQRNTDFSMIIINPADGAIVFQTTDATNGWDGTDRQTGKQVEANKAYIWKVSIKNPVPGERGEYKGTIVKL